MHLFLYIQERRKDLQDKDWVVLLRQSVDSSERSRVVGFSTMKFMSVAGEDILFSGDTVVDEVESNQALRGLSVML